MLKEPMVLRLCPQYSDPRALIQHGVATMARLCESENQGIAMEAAKWVVNFGQNLQAVKRSGPKEDHEVVVAELRALYAKALPQNRKPEQPPLVVEAESEEPEQK